MDVNKRITCRDALQHKWMIEGAAEQIAKIHAAKIQSAKIEIVCRQNKELRRLMKVAQIGICFMCRLKNMKYLKSCADRNDLRKRPFRNREVIQFYYFIKK